jgi:hypothetical protein
LPTLADLAGIKVASEKPLDGLSLKPLMTGATTQWPDRTLVTLWNGRMSLRTQQYRLDNTGGLFDMIVDPTQQRDISKQQPEETAKLKAEAEKWRAELSAKAGRDDRPFTVGYKPFTPLPARDGVPHGNVRRSDTAPNCSYFTNWKSPEDRITWEVEVGKPGKYEAVVYYACPAADVGSTVELSLGEARIRAKINHAHDPPLYGAEHDRVTRPRGESFMKDFKPLTLGTFELPAGRGQLALQAQEVKGQQVMEVRYVVLNRLP